MPREGQGQLLQGGHQSRLPEEQLAELEPLGRARQADGAARAKAWRCQTAGPFGDLGTAQFFGGKRDLGK